MVHLFYGLLLITLSFFAGADDLLSLYQRAVLEQKTRAAYLEMAASPDRNKATDRQLEANEKSRDAMRKGYELGVVTIIDLLNAENQLSEAREDQREARYKYILARSSLYFQSGRLIADELVNLNDMLVVAQAPAAHKSKAPH